MAFIDGLLLIDNKHVRILLRYFVESARGCETWVVPSIMHSVKEPSLSILRLIPIHACIESSPDSHLGVTSFYQAALRPPSTPEVG